MKFDDLSRFAIPLAQCFLYKAVPLCSTNWMMRYAGSLETVCRLIQSNLKSEVESTVNSKRQVHVVNVLRVNRTRTAVYT